MKQSKILPVIMSIPFFAIVTLIAKDNGQSRGFSIENLRKLPAYER